MRVNPRPRIRLTYRVDAGNGTGGVAKRNTDSETLRGTVCFVAHCELCVEGYRGKEKGKGMEKMEIENGTQFGLRLGMADSLPSFSARRRKKFLVCLTRRRADVASAYR